MEEIVSRLATAIVSIAKDEKKLEQYKTAFFELDKIFSSDTQLIKYLDSYFIKKEDKYQIVDKLTLSFNLPNLTNFIKLLIKKHQILKYKIIFKEIRNCINEELDIFEGIIYSTTEIDEEKIRKIENSLSKRIKHKVELTNKIDSRLIGGIKVQVHDYVFDGSIKYKIESLGENLKERRNTI